MRAYEIVAGSNSIDGLRRCERPDPVPLPQQILVRIQAAALNFRDLLIARGHYMGGTVSANTVPLSDGAGEVASSNHRRHVRPSNLDLQVHRSVDCTLDVCSDEVVHVPGDLGRVAHDVVAMVDAAHLDILGE